MLGGSTLTSALSRAERHARAVVDAAGRLEERVGRLSDTELAGTHAELLRAHRDGRSLDALAPEVFARVREAARRTLGLRPYDVQLWAGALIGAGNVAEARTGEGKTLVSTLPLVLHSLAWENVHAVTANPYLAGRDAEWMGPLYRALGLEVGVLHPEEAGRVGPRQEAYRANVTYGTTSEFGFDYLRDNLAHSPARQVQRGHGFCLVDEADAVLIDEARTPLIISGPADDHSDDYRRFAALVEDLQPGRDYMVDEALRTVTPLEGALAACEQMLGEDLHRPENVALVNHLVQAMSARSLHHRDRHYLLRDGRVLLIDETTGRVVPGRQWGQGLFQAVQAKEQVAITPETLTLASISVQNYFRLYALLGGTSGTARSDREELLSVYGMDAVVVPTNRPVARVDEPDLIYRGQRERMSAVVAEAGRRHAAGQPVLVGTPTVEMSEAVSREFTAAGLLHRTLNAKDPEAEADIIAGAGRTGAITIATNMAGRGVDIRLDQGVAELGGLCVIGTARNDSRRVDDQLRGRAGRQGDPGWSRFYLAADDELMRLFGGGSVAGLMAHLPGDHEGPIELPSLARAVVRAQRSVERQGADTRRDLLDYDETLHRQRLSWFSQRQRLVEGADLGSDVERWIGQSVEDLLAATNDQPQATSDALAALAGEPLELGGSREPQEQARGIWLSRRAEAPGLYAALERLVALTVLDRHWQAHLEAMDALKDGITLRSLAQQEPVIAYALDGAELYAQMQRRARDEIVRTLLRSRLMPASQG